jgi:hypothetical protein
MTDISLVSVADDVTDPPPRSRRWGRRHRRARSSSSHARARRKTIETFPELVGMASVEGGRGESGESARLRLQAPSSGAELDLFEHTKRLRASAPLALRSLVLLLRRSHRPAAFLCCQWRL